MRGLPFYLTSGSKTDGGVATDRGLPNWESNPGLRVQSPVRYPLGDCITLPLLIITTDMNGRLIKYLW